MLVRVHIMKQHNAHSFWEYDIAIIGGLGHVGLPLGIVFASKGKKVCLIDIDSTKAEKVKKGEMPFIEYGAETLLLDVLKKGFLDVSLDKSTISKAKNIIVAIGTPVDEYLNPKTREFLEFFDSLVPHITPNQLIVIRSTVYPHTCDQIERRLGKEKGWKISYCPERIIQGHAVRELAKLPQIVAGLSKQAQEEATSLFSVIAPRIIHTSMGEAELIKLFSNAWRYLQFAVTNQFYMIAHNFGVDYDRLRKDMMDGYGRNESLPSAGFAAGPCLLKDTMQLSAFSSSNFLLGHAAMMVNEGLPNYIVEDLRKRHDISKTKIGILGMAFKADIDDIRDSLSYKLGKILRFHGAIVFYSDEFVKNNTFVSKEELTKNSDIIIIGVPHSAYKGITFPKNKEIIDLWGITNAHSQ